ncbi:MAG: protease modulator HflC [Gammaproteobacteria bacterium]
MDKKIIFGILFIVVAILLGNSLFVVNEREKAILFKFGEIVRTDFEPGLHFKAPFVNNVRKFDSRVLSLDIERERFLTSEKKNLVVSLFVKWRIDDVKDYYTATRGIESVAASRISQIMKAALRSEVGKRELREVVSGDRDSIMGKLLPSANERVSDLGVTVIDARVTRIDLPQEVSESVFSRMRAERKRVADQLRSEGGQEAETIRAEADKTRTVILAEAEREAAVTRGEGDAQATETYARAFGQDEEFYSFTRSLDAYQKTFRSSADMLILKPDSDFFRYFTDRSGAGR